MFSGIQPQSLKCYIIDCTDTASFIQSNSYNLVDNLQFLLQSQIGAIIKVDDFATAELVCCPWLMFCVDALDRCPRREG